ncbi:MULTISPECIES: hypothetical protein [unclassified Leifsonia]|uniref:hypothetical protein n=1 Tax=unclassified Leifsonia TaxID=2663824 RepID=UPI0006FE52F3|nr:MULTISPECIES: hypothetical protein [unclassified Leifsonia]KQX07196.1 hypothetical protein ASC59_05210 [Leifsonia sp. Root1293]KRA11479.1 hypothetical protein ASD61_05210 [Leifsonia sp. Root60]
MDLRSETQTNPVADEVSAITAVVRPILVGILWALKDTIADRVGGREVIDLELLSRLRRPGDGDCGICFEYAVHDAMTRCDAPVVERIADALSLCNVSGAEIGSILFGAEKSGAQQLIETARDELTSDSILMSGSRGRPVKLKAHINAVAQAFRSRAGRDALPQSISGLWKADLFVGATDLDRWVGTTVKINETALEGARGLRVGVVPTRHGVSDAVRKDESRNLVICPLPYDGEFMEIFYMAWEVVQAVLAADARMPREVNLPRAAQREVARRLVDRRSFAVLDIVEALNALSQPELLQTAETRAEIETTRSGEGDSTTTAIIAPLPNLRS